MNDKLKLLDLSIPLQQRYDCFLIWLSSKNHVVIEFMAQDLGLTVSEVDVYNGLGELEDDEFAAIDKTGFDIGLLFIVLRAPEKVRRLMYKRSDEILKSSQPLTLLKEIVDENSDYTGIEELVKLISGNCWKSIASYLKQRNIDRNTLSVKLRSMLMGVGNSINLKKQISDAQLAWIIRAIQFDHSESSGVFTNEILEKDFNDDYQIFIKIHEHIEKYDTD
ncbi:hypothetical protein SF1_13710 [Sphingobacterium faecium NBRC 15299]|uniref:hypothetical protein n=1 Tax=Sphingobacterium faecium TaxID=34087 RepID=UPI000D393015|nr:hypothetical protein [Sphingobacterium faecium]PTX11836.1 hypothetical protein C8N37_103413 [Sphingobacterium faecium]GEM63389.1 hypothetical protein SF1_13710 [Sphingobacterium faecium NBRC 15299]